MSREDRINQALSQLVEHIVPVYPDDDEAAVDERLDQAYEHARQVVDAYV
jgi:gamma-tubulin complex component 3